MKTLPKVPSELITLALNDLELVEKDERYEVNMEVYHYPSDGKCLVCLAGAVMAKSLEVPPETNYLSYSEPNYKQLNALDYFRAGALHAGLYCLNFGRSTWGRFKECVHMPSYVSSPALFKSEMRDMAAQFKKAGL